MNSVIRQGKTYRWKEYNGTLREDIQNSIVDDPNHKIDDVDFSIITQHRLSLKYALPKQLAWAASICTRSSLRLPR